MKIRFFYLVLLAFLVCFNSIFSQWMKLYPRYPSNIWTCKADSSILFIGAREALYFSNNYGMNWNQIQNGLTATQIYAIYKDKNTVLASGGRYCNAGWGIFRSSDGGNIWKQVLQGSDTLGLPHSFTKCGSVIYLGFCGGVYKSNDEGITWKNISNELKSKTVMYLAAKDSKVFAAVIGYGLYVSTNQGNNWRLLNNGQSFDIVTSLLIKDNYIFMGTDKGIYYTTDEGNSWKKSNIEYDNNILINSLSTDGSILYAGTQGSGIYKSTDNGLTWFPSNNGLTFKYVYNINCSDKYIFAGTNDWLYYSTDKGENWKECPRVTEIPDGISFISKEKYIFLGTFSGVFRSSDNGYTWEQKNVGLSNLEIQSITYNMQNIFISTRNGVYYSDDNAENWKKVTHPKVGTQTFNAIAAKDNYIFAGGYKGVYRSSDNGTNWAPANSGLPEEVWISRIIVRSNYIYAGCVGSLGGVYVSSDNGDNWTLSVKGLKSIMVSAFSNIGDAIIIGTGNPMNGDTGGGIYVTENNGQSWNLVGLEGKNIHSLYVIGSNIFASTFKWTGGDFVNGMYLSSDNGITWREIIEGVPTPNAQINGFILAGDRILVATDNELLYRQLSEITGINDIYSHGFPTFQYALGQNYPNPFNPTTVINYDIFSTGNVTLKIFDVLGREVKTLVDDYKYPGKYKVTFESKNLSSGIYFYRMTSGNFIQTKKMILMK